jgi:superfamily II RNA helicase
MGAAGTPLTNFKGFQLSLFQLQAVEAIRAGHNVLVSAPTGAGKTLIAEYAIADAVRRGKRCVYTAPIKALSNQKYRDFRDDPEIEVGIMTGDVTLNARAQVLIMTTEILRNAMFEDPGQLADIEYVIFDEVHYMDDVERGSVWEESLIFAPEGIRFICLSATIANLDQLGAWLREIRRHELTVVRSDRRPVPLRHRLHAPGAGLFDPSRLAWVRERFAAAEDRGQRRARRAHGRGERQRDERPPDPEHAGHLFDQLQRQDLLPALCFAFSRKDCERLAGANQGRNLLGAEERDRMLELQRELIELFQLDPRVAEGEIFKLAAKGIGYHHAGMLPIHKEIVERMFTSGLLKLLFTTETFALGINMPARTVAFYSLRKFDGVAFDYLRTREYLQMAGRAGRQGKDREGLVISLLTPWDLANAPLERILSGAAEPILSRFKLSYSSLLHLHSHLGRERLYEAWEKSFDQYQHRAKNKKAREHNLREQRRVIDAHLAFLTELGYIDAAGGLSPRGKLARYLFAHEVAITEMVFRGTLETLPHEALAALFVALVYEERKRFPTRVPQRYFGGLRRHVSQLVRSLVQREAAHGVPTPMKEPDWGLTAVVAAWLEGRSFEELAAQTDTTPGDICRTFRMAIQLMRQTRRALGEGWDLGERLLEVMQAMNRDEVDAKRQLELG